MRTRNVLWLMVCLLGLALTFGACGGGEKKADELPTEEGGGEEATEGGEAAPEGGGEAPEGGEAAPEGGGEAAPEGGGEAAPEGGEGGAAPAEQSNGEEFVILQNEKGNIKFPHRAHQENVECATCHHTMEPNTTPQGCHSCHGVVEEAPKAKDAMHTRCKGCHKENEAGPTKCNGCHGTAE